MAAVPSKDASPDGQPKKACCSKKATSILRPSEVSSTVDDNECLLQEEKKDTSFISLFDD